MADYYPLIARAVTGLDKSTGEARRALYERARTALVTQLRGVEPALSEADITRERLALEEAIRKVEAESARRPRQEASEPRAEAAPPPPRFEMPAAFAPEPPPPPLEATVSETPPPPEWEELQRELDGLAASPSRESFQEPEPHHEWEASAPPPSDEPRADEPPLPFEVPPHAHETPPPEPPLPEAMPPAAPRRPDKRFSGERGSLVDQGLKGFRDVVAETDDLGVATASASKSARETREAYAALPPSSEIERIEPRVEPGFGPTDPVPLEEEAPPPPPRERRAGARARPVPPRPSPEEFEELEEEPLRGGLGGRGRRVITLAIVAVLAIAAFFAYREWGSGITGMFQSARVPATQAARDAAPARPKISDRIGGAQQDSARPAAGAGAAVAQRVVLYEQQSNPQERKQYVGSVIWRTEMTSPGPGQPPDVAVKAEVEIPERHMRMSFTVRRNLDQSLPASHTIEILFSTPADFEPGGIADVPAVLMENTEQTRGAPLAGLRVKVTNGFFLVGLSSVESEMRRNVQMLKERPWLHVRMAYNNGQLALMAIEKGIPGERAFEDALKAWEQTPPQAQR